MEEVQPPNFYSTYKFKIFVGGTIEMGKASDWQKKFMKEFEAFDVSFYNPRRDDWDSSWKQDPTPGTPFNRQVVWELISQDKCDLLVYYLEPGTISPITLMEIGIYGALYPNKVIVCAPKEYQRYGNVKIVADKLQFTLVESFDSLVLETKKVIKHNVTRKRHSERL